MAKALAWVAIPALIATLVLTMVSIWNEKPSATLFLDLTKTLLAWKVIVAGLATGAATTFRPEIKAFLTNLASRAQSKPV